MTFRPLFTRLFSSLPHLSLFHGTYADFLFSVGALPPSLFVVERPLVWIIERLLFTFLVRLLLPLGIGFFLLHALSTVSLCSQLVRKELTFSTGEFLFNLGCSY